MDILSSSLNDLEEKRIAALIDQMPAEFDISLLSYQVLGGWIDG